MTTIPTQLPDAIIVHPSEGLLKIRRGDLETELPMGSPEAFSLLSQLWLRAGWDAKYVYGFTWMGRPVIQLPEDMFRIQEVIHQVRPTLIIETGVAHGGSLIFYASLFEAMGEGRVVGVDIEIRPHNRRAIEEHAMAKRITLVEGSSIDPAIVQTVWGQIQPEDRVLVVLDSCHTKAHVLAELQAYAPMVSVGCYILAADGIMKDLVGAPRSQADWATNNPEAAAREFVAGHPEFVAEEPHRPFNEGSVETPVTYWPGGWLRRIR